MIIDAHQHFWNYSPQSQSWITEDMSVIRRSFLPADLEPVLQQSGVAGTVVVQAEQTESETAWLLQLATDHAWIKAVVGWTDLMAEDVDDKLAELQQHPALKGFRHIVQAEPDPRFMLQPKFISGIKAIGRAGYTYDVLVYPHQLDAAERLVAQCSNQKFVVDHLAKPYIKTGEIEGWKKDMQRLGSHPNVCAKLSGLITEASWQQWQPKDIQPYLDVALDVFGPNRLMWGSDWPVCLVAGSYGSVLQLVQQYIGQLSASEQEHILSKTATSFYNLI